MTGLERLKWINMALLVLIANDSWN